MKGKVKFALAVLLACMVCAAAVSSASAVEFIFHNTLDNKVNMAIVYYDRSTGLWTTRGWWSVRGNSSRTININNVDTSKNVLYLGASGKTLYYDKSTLNSKPVSRWISDEAFKFDSVSKAKPRGKNVRIAPFYKCQYAKRAGAYVIRINVKPVG